MLNFELSDDQKQWRDKARDFARTAILPVAWHYDHKDETPMQILDAAYQAGLVNTDIPKAYGGLGLGLLESVLLTEELAAACAGLATSIFDNSLGMEPLILCDNEGLKQRIFPEMLDQGKRICFATSEPTMGSDVAGMRCLATPDGEDYLLNGTKYWITNGGIADYASVFATIDPKSRHEGICAFVVPLDQPGVTRGRPIPKLGQRCSNTVGLHFKDVRVPKENLLAEPGKGFVLAMKTFARTRPTIGAFGVGAARTAMELALDYLNKRRTFGMPLSGYQALQFKIAEMYQKIETSRLLCWKAAWEADRGQDPTIDASISKFYATEAALEVVDEALQICGGYGYTQMFPVEKLWRDTRLLRIYEGTSEIQRIIVAGHLLNNYTPVMPSLEDLPVHLERDPADLAPGEQAWRCRICGHVHYGSEAPDECPYCFFPQSAFKAVTA
ncbi:MAG: acyl-CoA dehydrogenase family protein [Desulfosarcinaceae bacterium]|nr:acyl-CoA dehydrogenase family protein [Desulfosarcinaceae bacterium]